MPANMTLTSRPAPTVHGMCMAFAAELAMRRVPKQIRCGSVGGHRLRIRHAAAWAERADHRVGVRHVRAFVRMVQRKAIRPVHAPRDTRQPRDQGHGQSGNQPYGGRPNCSEHALLNQFASAFSAQSVTMTCAAETEETNGRRRFVRFAHVNSAGPSSHHVECRQ